MHLLIPFAFSLSEGCHQALPALKLPKLQKLLQRLTPLPPDSDEAFTYSPPHERVLARARGLPFRDGLLPWAALHASAQFPSTQAPWAFVTPCHWQVGSKYIAMSAPEQTHLSAADSQALLTTLQPFFEEDGITLHPDQPQRWLARGEPLRALISASLDRVSGRNIADWMPRGPSATLLERLQSEVQMLLYHHPVNEARMQQGLLPINSFWLSGTGALPAHFQLASSVHEPTVAQTLRDAALAEDWVAWRQAWESIDAIECAALLQAIAQGGAHQLTLCGERSSLTWHSAPQSLLHRLKNTFTRERASDVLQQL